MSDDDDVMKKQQKLAEIKEIMSQFQEKLTSTTRELNETREKLASKKSELEEANVIMADLNRKIKELEEMLSQKDSEIQKLKEANVEKDKVLKQQAVQKEQVEKETHVASPQETIVEVISGERIICPKCSARGTDIKTLENRDKILDYLDHKPIYAKKYICRKCGREF